MQTAGFTVPFDYEPTVQVPTVPATYLDGADLILRVGDFPVTAEYSADLLGRWAEAAQFDINGVHPHQAVDILFVAAVTSAVLDEQAAAGLSGSVPIYPNRLRRDGAPERFLDYCERIDGDFIMAVLTDQFDTSVQRGATLRTAVRRRCMAGKRQRAGAPRAGAV